MSTPDFVKGLSKLSFQDEELPIHKLKTDYSQISLLMFVKTTEFRVRTFFYKGARYSGLD
jgi:hypothetical protein